MGANRWCALLLCGAFGCSDESLDSGGAAGSASSSAVGAGAGGSGGSSGEGGSGGDRPYDLTRVGVAIRRGRAGKARVFASADGQSWTTIADAANRTHHALEYFALAKPVRATFVKVEVDPHVDCDPELGESCSVLNELELYSTVNSFENDPVGRAPRGYGDVRSAWVTDYQTRGTRHALRLVDDSDAAIAQATWQGTPALEKTLAFSVEPLSLPHGFLFSVRGRNAEGAPTAAYRFAVMPDGRVARYDTASETWVSLTEPNAVPSGAATPIRVEATLEGARLFVAGAEVAAVPPSTPGAVALDAHAFASAGTKPVGDQVLVDDVLFQ